MASHPPDAPDTLPGASARGSGTRRAPDDHGAPRGADQSRDAAPGDAAPGDAAPGDAARRASSPPAGHSAGAPLAIDREPASTVPSLTAPERHEVVRRTAISAVVVHEAIREEGERELRRSLSGLAASALAAGLSMGFSLVGQGLITAYLPDAPWRPLIASLGYSVGFLIVILGRQQLFTENTLTVILPLLSHPNWATFARVARLWGVVLLGNLLGAFIFATVVAQTALFPASVQRGFVAASVLSLRGTFGLVVVRAIFAGWLIALMVWLLPSAEAARVHIILIITYMVALGGFAHIIAGSVDVLYLVSVGVVTWPGFLVGFLLPTFIGNVVGGTSLVAALNFAQVAAPHRPE